MILPEPPCTKFAVSAVVWMTPMPPGDRFPVLFSVLPAPRLTVAPGSNVPPTRLLKVLRPGPRSTLPITVPPLLTVLLPPNSINGGKLKSGIPRMAVPERPPDVVIVPKFVSVLLPPPIKTIPAPLPEPPVIVPLAILTTMSPLVATAAIAAESFPDALTLPDDVTLTAVPEAAIPEPPIPSTDMLPVDVMLTAPPYDWAAIPMAISLLSVIDISPDDTTLTAPSIETALIPEPPLPATDMSPDDSMLTAPPNEKA